MVFLDKAGIDIDNIVSIQRRQATTRGLSVSVLKSPGMPLLTNQTSRLRYVWSSSVTVRIMFPL